MVAIDTALRRTSLIPVVVLGRPPVPKEGKQAPQLPIRRWLDSRDGVRVIEHTPAWRTHRT
jgi:hypothetical protein